MPRKISNQFSCVCVCVIPQLDANSPAQGKRQFSRALPGGNPNGSSHPMSLKQREFNTGASQGRSRSGLETRPEPGKGKTGPKQLRDNTEIWAIQNNPDDPDLQPHVCMRTSTATSQTSSNHRLNVNLTSAAKRSDVLCNAHRSAKNADADVLMDLEEGPALQSLMVAQWVFRLPDPTNVLCLVRSVLRSAESCRGDIAQLSDAGRHDDDRPLHGWASTRFDPVNNRVRDNGGT